jgi:hypothetical protein
VDIGALRPARTVRALISRVAGLVRDNVSLAMEVRRLYGRIEVLTRLLEFRGEVGRRDDPVIEACRHCGKYPFDS